MSQKSGPAKLPSERIVRGIRRATRKLHSMSRSIVAAIYQKPLYELPFWCPDLHRQKEIVRRIEHAFAATYRLAAQAARALLDKLDQAILAKAFRGELVPQDPNDEPASVLLERIRAGCDAAPAKPRGRKRRAVS